jgi:nicotinamide-nucleotide amidase
MSLQTDVQDIQAQLIDRRQTLALAESCTGGRLAAEVTKVAGSSRYFLGGVVSYHGSVKHKILKVPSEILQKYGEVSTQVALAMAQGARNELGSDWAVGISGVAGPTGGSVDKPVGHVCFAIVGPNYEWSGFRRFGERRTRDEVQTLSTEFAAQSRLSALDGRNPDASR